MFERIDVVSPTDLSENTQRADVVRNRSTPFTPASGIKCVSTTAVEECPYRSENPNNGGHLRHARCQGAKTKPSDPDVSSKTTTEAPPPAAAHERIL